MTHLAFDTENNDDLHVETADPPSMSVIQPPEDKKLCVETASFDLKECSIRLVSLESILLPEKKSGRKNKNSPHGNSTPAKSKPVPQPAKADPDNNVPASTDTKLVPTVDKDYSIRSGTKIPHMLTKRAPLPLHQKAKLQRNMAVACVVLGYILHRS